jgi:hypothetical protein
MKFRILFFALVSALLAASVAVAKDNPGKGSKPETQRGKPAKPTTGPNCRPRVKVVLKGTLASDPAEGDTSFQMNVTKANKHGRAYLSAAQPITVNVDEKTKTRRKAKGSKPTKTLESLELGDRIHMQAKACKADLKDGGTPALTARHLKAKPAAPLPPPPPPPPPPPTA